MFKWLFGNKASTNSVKLPVKKESSPLLNELNTLSSETLRNQALQKEEAQRAYAEQERLNREKERQHQLDVQNQARAAMTPTVLSRLTAELKDAVKRHPKETTWDADYTIQEVLQEAGCLMVRGDRAIAVRAIFPVVQAHFEAQKLKVTLAVEPRYIGMRTVTHGQYDTESQESVYHDLPCIKISW